MTDDPLLSCEDFQWLVNYWSLDLQELSICRCMISTFCDKESRLKKVQSSELEKYIKNS